MMSQGVMRQYCGRPKSTCEDQRGSLRGQPPLLHPVGVDLLLNLLQLPHGVQAVAPPLLLHRLAKVGLVGQLESRLHNLLLQGEAALQVPEVWVLQEE